jgi:Ca2+-binding RTX toxin-like protein
VSAVRRFVASVVGADTEITVVETTVDDGGGGGNSGGTLVVSDSPSGSGSETRTISNTTSSWASAAIVQDTGNNGNVVTAIVPASVSVTSEGPSTAQSGDAARDTLINAIDVRDTAGEGGAMSGAEGFLNSLPPNTPLDVRTVVATTLAGGDGSQPLIITGTGDPNQIEAFVVDMRQAPGLTLQVDNIEFLSVMGATRVTGGAGNNYAVGDDHAQFISLGVGDDTLYGGGGNDTIGSGAGRDLLYGDDGDDLVFGGDDNDTIFGGADQDVLYGNQGADVVYGNSGLDTLYGGQGDDVMYGGQHQDVLYGNLGDDVLYGNLGGDTLYGGGGNDVLYGGRNDGNALESTAIDVLYGGVGNDTLYGGQGDDLLYGGDGADLFVIEAGSGNDTIADFDGGGGDRVRIAANANGTTTDTFAELLAVSANRNGGVEIALGGGNSLLLMGVNTGDLKADWFVFV